MFSWSMYFIKCLHENYLLDVFYVLFVTSADPVNLKAQDKLHKLGPQNCSMHVKYITILWNELLTY